MTQPHHGSSRTEVDDLRHIVDRLDLLMGGPGARSGRAGTSPRDEALAELGERVEALEGEVDELRTLVNHLMTIATWQAKVTATLVDDRADDDVGPTVPESEPQPESQSQSQSQSQYPGSGHPQAHERDGDGDGAPPRRRSQAPATTLDDDIDEILGSERGGAHPEAAPPDFGI